MFLEKRILFFLFISFNFTILKGQEDTVRLNEVTVEDYAYKKYTYGTKIISIDSSIIKSNKHNIDCNTNRCSWANLPGVSRSIGHI